MKAADFDHPLLFLIVISIGVAVMWALFRATFAFLGWSGPLGLFTGGIGYNPASKEAP